jgi:hypothetical protein
VGAGWEWLTLEGVAGTTYAHSQRWWGACGVRVSVLFHAGPWLQQYCMPFPGIAFFVVLHTHPYILAHTRLTHADGLPGEWHFTPTPDTFFVAIFQIVFGLIPATLWVAWVVGGRVLTASRAPLLAAAGVSSGAGSNSPPDCPAKGPGKSSPQGVHEGGEQPGSSAATQGQPQATLGGRFSWAQLAALGALAAVNWVLLYHKAWIMMGGPCLLVSPGFAWLLPLAAGLAWVGGDERPAKGGTPRSSGKGE